MENERKMNQYKPSCNNCKFWLKEDFKDTQGTCRHPNIQPSVIAAGGNHGQLQLITTWPTLRSHEWCGKHDRKIEEFEVI